MALSRPGLDEADLLARLGEMVASGKVEARRDGCFALRTKGGWRIFLVDDKVIEATCAQVVAEPKLNKHKYVSLDDFINYAWHQE